MEEAHFCAKMVRIQPSLPNRPLLLLFFFLFVSQLCNTSLADVGTAAQYSPPYLPTACDGSNPAQFPSSNLFGAAGDGIWDNGASCGRQYLVRCISASSPGTCKPDETIQIKIVDYALTSQSQPSVDATTIVLSSTAFATIADSSAASINIEFQQ
ncbi:hypothetical protein JRO89_XS04G0241600 [Xanthoceras sorbifolium]|uniref:Expansin-like EG45 domain-containing protein n=1 Tax=Xanthoceras sorbifolium TaxID=99658 RepID=A0ABQ8I6U1_9ROSI|nr:hypothetical protein JRO89_XS04G0241600 [Xanthoceras sorbifolium]